ncbi:Hypothetical predicted protein, partial [Paramuricea clavata]
MASNSTSSLLGRSDKAFNGTKLMRLILDDGTEALRNIFRKFYPGNLQVVLSRNQRVLSNHRSGKIINQNQWDKLYPVSPNQPNIMDFDITLLSVLLRNICHLSPPFSGWDKMPNISDHSVEADIIRIRFFRNERFGHIPNTAVSTADFKTFWAEISLPLVRLGIDQKEIDRLENEECGGEEVERVVKEWNEWDNKIINALEENRLLVRKEEKPQSDSVLNKYLVWCDFQKEIELHFNKFVNDLEVMFAVVCVDNTYIITDYIIKLTNHEMYNIHVSENVRKTVSQLIFLIKKANCFLSGDPQTFFQIVVNEGPEQFSLKASNLLQTRYKDIIYFEFFKKDKLQDCCCLSGRLSAAEKIDGLLMLPHCVVFHPRKHLILPDCCFSLDGSKMVTNSGKYLIAWDVLSGVGIFWSRRVDSKFPVEIVSTFDENSTTYLRNIALPINVYSSNEIQCFLKEQNNSKESLFSKMLKNFKSFDYCSFRCRHCALRYILMDDNRSLVFQCHLNLNTMYVFSMEDLRDTESKAFKPKYTHSNMLAFLVVRDGVILFGENDTPELWNSDLVERLDSFGQLVGPTRSLSDSICFFNVFTKEEVYRTNFNEGVRTVHACRINYHVVATLKSNDVCFWKGGKKIDAWTNAFYENVELPMYTLPPLCIWEADFSTDGNRLALSIFGNPCMIYVNLKFYDNENLICISIDSMLYFIDVKVGEMSTLLDISNCAGPISKRLCCLKSACLVSDTETNGRNCSSPVMDRRLSDWLTRDPYHTELSRFARAQTEDVKPESEIDCLGFASNIGDKEKEISLHAIPYSGDERPEAKKRRKKWTDFVSLKHGLKGTRSEFACSQQSCHQLTHTKFQTGTRECHADFCNFRLKGQSVLLLSQPHPKKWKYRCAHLLTENRKLSRDVKTFREIMKRRQKEVKKFRRKINNLESRIKKLETAVKSPEKSKGVEEVIATDSDENKEDYEMEEEYSEEESSSHASQYETETETSETEDSIDLD